MIYSHSSDQAPYKKIHNKLVGEINKEFGNLYTLNVEYLRVEQYPKGSYPKEVFDLYNKKYRDVKLDLLICIGMNAIEPIKKNAEKYLLNLPTISADLDFSNYGYPSDLRLNDQTAILGFQFNFERTLETAFSLFPETTTINYISGTSPLDKFLMTITKGAASKFSTVAESVFIEDISMNETLERISNLQNNNIIFIPYFTTDSKLVPYHNPEAIRLIHSKATAPIFHLSSIGFGEGSVGGYILNYEKIGFLIGHAAVNILKGADPNLIKVDEEDYYEYLFDWRELKYWNLEDSELIPEGSTILYKEITFWSEYKWFITIGISFLIFQTLLIINLIRLNKNQKLLTSKIIESENRYRGFLHEDRSLRLGQLTASLSHELNQPLTAILSTAQAGINFIESNNSNHELQKEILQKIVENNKRTSAILNSIKGMMKLETREKENVNLNYILEETLAIYNSEAISLNIKIDLNLLKKQVYVLADKVQIQQIILNLISNAAQAMENTPSSEKLIVVNQIIENDNVIVSVRDHGEGIDESLREILFKPFLTSKKEGTGIGLVICKSIIEEHHGKIWAENKSKDGAEFSFSLKLAKYE